MEKTLKRPQLSRAEKPQKPTLSVNMCDDDDDDVRESCLCPPPHSVIKLSPPVMNMPGAEGTQARH